MAKWDKWKSRWRFCVLCITVSIFLIWKFYVKNLKEKKGECANPKPSFSFLCGLPSWCDQQSKENQPVILNAYSPSFCTWGWSRIFLNCKDNPTIPLKFLLCFLTFYPKTNSQLPDIVHADLLRGLWLISLALFPAFVPLSCAWCILTKLRIPWVCHDLHYLLNVGILYPEYLPPSLTCWQIPTYTLRISQILTSLGKAFPTLQAEISVPFWYS